MLRETFLNLVEDLDVDVAAGHSFKDFHARGLNYVCLHRTPSFTAKLYVARPGETIGLVPHEILVNPHTHAYSFETAVLAGELQNVRFVRTEASWVAVWHEFLYATPLNGLGRESHYAGPVRLHMSADDWLRPGMGGPRESYTLSHEAIHSIRLRPGVFTALLLFQHADQPKPFTSLFMPTKELPSLDGLYGRFTTDEIRSILDETKRQMGAGV